MSKNVEKTRVSITMTAPYLEALDHMVEKGVYLRRCDVIMDALRHLFKEHGVDLPYKEAEPK